MRNFSRQQKGTLVPTKDNNSKLVEEQKFSLQPEVTNDNKSNLVSERHFHRKQKRNLGPTENNNSKLVSVVKLGTD